MTAPAFEFTDRATPLVQMGRSARNDSGNRWQEGLWGSGLWGVRDWEVLWTDLTCEIHEITTDVGRGSAADRFVPGTAYVVASNVHGLSDMIFPRAPGGEGFTYVPQPPIEHEEDLQAPAAATVVSNGWSFTDDFETRPPRWIAPPAFLTTGVHPTTPFLFGDGHIEAELYRDAANNWEAHSAAQWTGPHPWPLQADCELLIADLDWPVAATAGTPQLVVEMYTYGNTTDQACNCARFTFTPNFSGDNTATVDLFQMAADGSRVDGISTPVGYPSGLGSSGHFGPLLLRIRFDPDTNFVMAAINGIESGTFGFTDWVTGNRLGFAVHYVEGVVAGAPPPAPHITWYAGPASVGIPAFEDDFARPTGSGWIERQWGPLIMEAGALRPPLDWNGTSYSGHGSAQWVSDFVGDQFIEAELTGMSSPIPYGVSGSRLELHLKGNRRDGRSITAIIDYVIDWDPDECSIDWRLVQYGPNEEWVYNPDIDGESVGTIDVGVTDGMFPEPAIWRLEADSDGTVRLYYQRDLLGQTDFPDIPDGGRVGVYLDWAAGSPTTVGNQRPDVTRIERISAGLAEPLGTEQLGTWVRIGVDHTSLGTHWMFRGFCDALVPTYVPDRPDAVRIECVDSLGEAGRVKVDTDQMNNPLSPAPNRIRQILNRAHWPQHFRNIRDDSTIMSRPESGKAVDALTHVAESCGGAIYGDPVTGDVVFRGQDWQAASASSDPDVVITNYQPDYDFGIPRVCPSGWERSSRRQDMLTRVKFTSVTSDTEDGHEIVREWAYPQAEQLYGVEMYERTLLCITAERLNELAIRQLRLRNPNQFPRVEAVLLDAATAEECLDLMTTVTFTKPTKAWCQLRRGNEFVFSRKMLVTGIRHRMTPGAWTCRLALDLSSIFYVIGGRWDEGRWGSGEWGRSR